MRCMRLRWTGRMWWTSVISHNIHSFCASTKAPTAHCAHILTQRTLTPSHIRIRNFQKFKYRVRVVLRLTRRHLHVKCHMCDVRVCISAKFPSFRLFFLSEFIGVLNALATCAKTLPFIVPCTPVITALPPPLYTCMCVWLHVVRAFQLTICEVRVYIK